MGAWPQAGPCSRDLRRFGSAWALVSQGLAFFFAFSGGTGCMESAYVKMIKHVNGQKRVRTYLSSEQQRHARPARPLLGGMIEDPSIAWRIIMRLCTPTVPERSQWRLVLWYNTDNREPKLMGLTDVQFPPLFSWPLSIPEVDPAVACARQAMWPRRSWIIFLYYFQSSLYDPAGRGIMKNSFPVLATLHDSSRLGSLNSVALLYPLRYLRCDMTWGKSDHGMSRSLATTLSSEHILHEWCCIVKVSLPLLSQFAAESWQPGQIEAGERWDNSRLGGKSK